MGVPWLSGRHELVAIYRDVHGRTYTTVCGSNRNKFFRENRHPSMQANRDQWLEDPIWEGRHHTKLRESDLEHLSPLQLLLLRNSIYAKHGYIFPSPDFAAFFSRQSWYQPREDSFDVVEAKLTVGELAEAQMILGVFYRHPNATRGPFPELLNPENDVAIPPILGHAPTQISAQAAMQTQASVERTLPDQI